MATTQTQPQPLQQPLLQVADEKEKEQKDESQTCRQFQDLPPSFQMPTILKIIGNSKGPDLLTLRKRVRQRLTAYNYIDRYSKTVSDKAIPANVLKTTKEFEKLAMEYTVPTIMNLLSGLSEVDLKEMLELIDARTNFTRYCC